MKISKGGINMDIIITIFHYEFYISVGYNFLIVFFGFLAILQCFKAICHMDHKNR